MNNKNRTSQTTSNTYNPDFNADTLLWSETRSSEEDDILMRKGRIKINDENTNKEVKRKSRDKKEIKRDKCNRKIRVETVNEEAKESSSEEEDIGIYKCRRRSRADNMNKELKGWKS